MSAARAPTCTRRRWIGGAAAMASAAVLPACNRTAALEGGWVGSSPERGHALRDAAAASAPAPSGPLRHADVLIVGAGVAGLAAARALRRAGIDDFALLELEDQGGGNARGHVLGGQPCPLAAHYLPVPGEAASEVRDFLVEAGLARWRAGRFEPDERHLVHSPQERLFVGTRWQEGLLPEVGDDPAALTQLRRFAAEVERHRRAGHFRMPALDAPWNAELAALDAQTFDDWLRSRGLDHAALTWYLGYASRDEYGALPARVSAWAGLHYFASRHGFAVPGDDGEGRDAVLTWPEGNARLVAALAAPLGGRLHTGQAVRRVRVERHGVVVDVAGEAGRTAQRWQARQVVLALPLFVAARLCDPCPEALRQAAATAEYAPWLVANLLLGEPLLDRIGAAPAWDNVLHASPSLGYVDAGHQRLEQPARRAPSVLTAYWALGGARAADGTAARAQLLAEPWPIWADRVVADLAQAHNDLPGKLRRIDLARHGHAMSIPVPGRRASVAQGALAALHRPHDRLWFAHADLAGYSVFEEAFTLGERCGAQVARALRGA